MNCNLKNLAATICASAAVLASANAAPVTYSIAWTGSSNYSLSGSFSFDEALLGTGAITGTSLNSFAIEVFLAGVSAGTWDYFANGVAPGGAVFNFNFNTTTESFAVGGSSPSANGQLWNAIAGSGLGCTGRVGFISGASAQGVCIDGLTFGSISTSQSTLTAARVGAVPEPGSAWLLALGLAGVLALRRRA